MANTSRNFSAGRMNKSVDERLVPDGEYIDAVNCRIGSAEMDNDMGVIENALGNSLLVQLKYNNQVLSSQARTIGAYEDGANETLYWFVHDPAYAQSATGKMDMIVSYNTQSGVLTYHIVSMNDGEGENTTLNFNPSYLITGVDLVDANEEGLLFWTDDYNPPRFINIKRGYAQPVGGVDGFSAESILVIKRPPVISPSVQPIVTAGQQNFLEERFICFAYRYRYADGEYSATSQFSEPAFIPNVFEFSASSYLNEGMVNTSNTAIITYNTGGPLVKGVDLLFKEAGSNVIKVIEKIDKVKMGLPNNADIQYTFTNSKIFTVLPDSELLRLYDNVPLLAKAQTIMGNRLMYGNYVEGYDMKDAFSNDVFINYVASLDSKVLDSEVIPDGVEAHTYTINTNNTVQDAVFTMDLSSVADALVAGAQLIILVRFTHASFTGNTPPPTEETQSVEISWTFTLLSDYDSVYEMANSTEFYNAVGTVVNIKPVYAPNADTSCDGFTLTDIFNCALPNDLSGATNVTKYQSGVSVPNQPVQIIASPSSDIIKFVFPAMNYVGDVNAPFDYSVYEYYTITYGEALWSGLGIPKSLHSNRGYEVGMVYMDEYGRSSSALVSEDNTVHVPCAYSDRQNKIIVTIPTTQRAPWWAKRYKFVLKADRENYETIYSNVFFRDPAENLVYILLDGENSRKVEVGDRLIVKADSSGASQNCKYITVLEKEEKPQGFLEIPSPGDPEVLVNVPGGVYMKINPNNISITQEENSYITAKGEAEEKDSGDHPVAFVRVNITETPGAAAVDYTIPSNSRIRLNFKFERKGTGDGNNQCERRIYTFERNYIASADYDNFADWWEGDNIGATLNGGVQQVGGNGGPITNEYLSGIITVADLDPEFTLPGQPGGGTGYAQVYAALNPQIGTNKYKFVRVTNPTTGYLDNNLYLAASGTRACGSIPKKKRSSVSLEIEVFRSDNTLIFETQPQDTLPNVFFENHKSFEIDINGNHYGDIQNQDIATNQPAIIDTGFFNCYTFGNGVESYKVRDSVVGKTFNLGNRVTSVSKQEFKEEDRYADITYSGIYNDETNVNRLNEFNAGLANFKNLENSFGAITIIDGRETDVLVLQEDKVSYVLAGKNLLSDASAGSVITSIPEVLGTQIARIEDYGNSFNPESYIRWGDSKFFTDAKRGVVIQLIGQSHANEQLLVISDTGMREWFRDLFVQSLNKQKLGGYDPYSSEYVLSTNGIDIPLPAECIECGTPVVVTSQLREQVSQYCVDLGNVVGGFTVSYQVIELESSNTFQVECIYNGATYPSGYVNTSGSLPAIEKGFNTPTQAVIKVYNQTNLKSVVQVTVNCPVPVELKIVEVVITNDSDNGKYIHTEYGYTKQTYVSPVTSNLVQFLSGDNPLVSRYNILSGYQGSGSIPQNGSTVMMGTNKIGFDNFDVNPATHRFLWLRSDTLYNNNSTDIASLLNASASITIQGTGPSYYGNFTLPSNTQEYLYLVWDLRNRTAVSLCNGATTYDACCGCITCFEECLYYYLFAYQSGYVRYTECFTGTVKDVYLYSYDEIYTNMETLLGELEDASLESCMTNTIENLFTYRVCSMAPPAPLNNVNIVVGEFIECGCPI